MSEFKINERTKEEESEYGFRSFFDPDSSLRFSNSLNPSEGLIYIHISLNSAFLEIQAVRTMKTGGPVRGLVDKFRCEAESSYEGQDQCNMREENQRKGVKTPNGGSASQNP